MKCPACGRRMVQRGRYLDCPNILCDYEEEIETDEVIARLKEELRNIICDEPATMPCLFEVGYPD